ncbi:MAG: 4a-hydroxytetrahydrobiopterin dehydratase [Bacteroidetes bacterium]|nr:4a-hydroxytetrahydrobiopterin dehydratase [Bacteroidota bacterium]MBS1628584.1 4a-hydroxytetrahydrobiopterin dehydratase [Bacteroidota bacterium]
MQALDSGAIHIALETLPGWSMDGSSIQKDFLFADFNEAFAFLSRIALYSEKMNHHAEWSGVYNQVHIRLSTHDAGGVTEKDLKMAHALESYC